MVRSALLANASLGLLDVDNPDTPAINESTDGKLRLSDFTTAGFDDILVPSFDYSGSANLPIDGSLLTSCRQSFSLVVRAHCRYKPASAIKSARSSRFFSTK